jgi:hypothetical protein
MATVTPDSTEQIRELEELWAAPAVAPPVVVALAPDRRRRMRLPALPLVPGAPLAAGWLVFFSSALLFEPPPEPGMTWAPWMMAISVAQIVLLLAAAGLGPMSGALGFCAAAIAGPLGIALAVSCRATEHHLGNWWLVELGATAALTGLATVGLGQRLRGE